MPTYVDTCLGRVALTEHGRGPDLLLLHANPGDSRDFDAVIPRLARTHRVLALDWPGYGSSPPPVEPRASSAIGFAQLAIALVDRLGLRDLAVVGNSVGGYAAVRLALARPERVRALVLANPGGFTPPTLASRVFCWVKGREWVTRAVAARFARHYLRARNEHVRAILERAESGRRDPIRVAIDAAIWRSFADPEHDLRRVARGLRAPTLIVWGAHDPVLRASVDRQIAQRTIEGSQLVTLATGHMPFAEDPVGFLAAVEPFLAATDRPLAERAS